jgi:uncharacterized protein
VLALFASMFILGLATSTHCVGMCGPMVVTYAVKGEADGPWHRKVVPNLLYQVAKLVSYALVGLVLGAVGSAFNLNGLRPWAMLAAGAFMIVLGLGMTGRFPWATRLTPRPPKALVNALSGLRRRAKSDAAQGESSLATPVAFGLLTGLMPCAPLQGAELTAASAAATTGSFLTGGLAMLAFGLGTFPLLFAFGTASSLIPADWRHRLNLVLAVVVMLLGLVFLNRAALLTGFPLNSTTVRSAVVGGQTPATEFTTAADGVAEVSLKIINTQYVPQSVSIPAGRRVRLVVDRQEDVACSNRLVIRQLGVDVPLADNAVTKVDLPASAAGTYAMTCGMGMMSGQIVATGPGSGGGSSPMLWLVITIAAVVGAGLLLRKRPESAPTKPAAKRRA